MKEGKMRLFLKTFSQKNILLTIIAFSVGLILQLADTTIILLVIGIAGVSTWWQWRPKPINPESKLIIDTLNMYPAVLIKNYPHIIAFNSAPPSLAVVYQSPVSVQMLKRYITKGVRQAGEIEVSVSCMDLDNFLILKGSLSPYTSIEEIFQIIKSIINLLELQLQSSFSPAERYQIIRLFGLEMYLQQLKKPSLIPINQALAKA
ncbi:MAG: hypothetical protein ACFFBD_10665 [Candidatus Hodarchaeota archaeon]